MTRQRCWVIPIVYGGIGILYSRNEESLTLVYKNINSFIMKRCDVCVRERESWIAMVDTTLQYIYSEHCFFVFFHGSLILSRFSTRGAHPTPAGARDDLADS